MGLEVCDGIEIMVVSDLIAVMPAYNVSEVSIVVDARIDGVIVLLDTQEYNGTIVPFYIVAAGAFYLRNGVSQSCD